MSDDPTIATANDDDDDLPSTLEEIERLEREAASLTPEEIAALDPIVDPPPIQGAQLPLRSYPQKPIDLAKIAADRAANAWRNLIKFEQTRNGPIVPGSVNNALVYLTHDPKLQGLVAYDELRECIVRRRQIDWAEHESVPVREELGADEWDDADDTRLVAWFDRTLRIKITGQTLRSAINVVAQRARFHPVRDYLRGLTWDATPRLNTWLSTYLGTAQTAYEQAIGVRWMISAVARVMRPGCQADHVMALEGPTGRGKSSALYVLANPWFSDDDLQIGSAEAAKSLRGVWIQELGELPRMTSRNGDALKAFITRRQDHYRDSYGHRAQNFPRRSVFAGTTEDDQYLADPRGGRRWWGVRVGAIDLDALKRDRDQLWAEAVVRFDQNEPWHVDSRELAELCAEQQAGRVIVDPWATRIAAWVETMSTKQKLREQGYLTVVDALSLCLEIPAERQDRSASIRVGQAFGRIGWSRRRFTDTISRPWGYVPPDALPL